ncbi:hypothetical protein ACFL0Q_09600 [Thermodesulfobacteriota bacterium]
MAINCLQRWEHEFRKAAVADNLSLCRDHLQRLGLPDDPELLLKGTVLVVHACCAYATLDGQSPGGFLKLQKYRPTDAPEAKYALTFDLYGKAFARVLISTERGVLDLADLYGHPWYEFEVCGYSRFWVSRTDWQDLSADELAQIQTEITEDLRFDYEDDELDFWFDDTVIQGALEVNLQDVDPCEDQEEEE